MVLELSRGGPGGSSFELFCLEISTSIFKELGEPSKTGSWVTRLLLPRALERGHGLPFPVGGNVSLRQWAGQLISLGFIAGSSPQPWVCNVPNTCTSALRLRCYYIWILISKHFLSNKHRLGAAPVSCLLLTVFKLSPNAETVPGRGASEKILSLIPF